jgi:hypothetical protein
MSHKLNNLRIMAKVDCVGCQCTGDMVMYVSKIDNELLWVNDMDPPEGWVEPRPWDDEELGKVYSRYNDNKADPLFHNRECMLKYYGAR